MKVTKERNDHAAEEHGRTTALVAMHGLCTQAHHHAWWPCIEAQLCAGSAVAIFNWFLGLFFGGSFLVFSS